jgi:S-adenosylhomocysteine hydrolase
VKLPLLEYFVDKKRREMEKILEDKCIIMVLHFLRDLIPFLDGLRELGADSENCWILAKPYPYPYKNDVKRKLDEEGFNVNIAERYPIDLLCGEILNKAYRNCIYKRKKMLIIEDGGYIGSLTPTLTRSSFSYSQNIIIGAVEQTTKGYRKYMHLKSNVRLFFPVVAVASSEFKREYEPRFIGQAVVRNIRKFLSEVHLAGKKALIYGYGSIGSMVAHYLKTIEGMNVDVCEVNLRRGILARFDNFNTKTNIKEFAEKNWYLVIGCTGGREENGKEMPTIDEEVISLLPHGCALISASSDQIEIDVECLNRLSEGNIEDVYIDDPIQSKIKIGTKYKLTQLRKTLSPPEIILLADGYPINFYRSESVPNESIDPILTLLFLSTVYLAKYYKNLRRTILSKEVDEIIEKEKMLEVFSKLHGFEL